MKPPGNEASNSPGAGDLGHVGVLKAKCCEAEWMRGFFLVLHSALSGSFYTIRLRHLGPVYPVSLLGDRVVIRLFGNAHRSVSLIFKGLTSSRAGRCP